MIIEKNQKVFPGKQRERLFLMEGGEKDLSQWGFFEIYIEF